MRPSCYLVFFLICFILPSDHQSWGLRTIPKDKNELAVPKMASRSSQHKGLECKNTGKGKEGCQDDGESEESMFENGDYIYTNSHP
ncbi:hypothetical protein AMTR_s00001p00268580 [Amborella trichopoda]|uniref:Phytosulfokine-beta n=1 Tax=Amborella trichopoda TaxID=13333 RepID=W1NL28_AMBTC|nr:hypothetical protein AMTR_s00001p00268580 [Amborella trichopoda]